MLESGIVAHCAPTLAGIKTANMFNYLPDDMEDLPREVQEENRKLNGKGVYVEILRTGEKRALIYVYRKNKLEADLNREPRTSFRPVDTNAGERTAVFANFRTAFFSMNASLMRWDCSWDILWMM